MYAHLLQKYILLQLVIQLDILLFCLIQIVLTDEYLETNIGINIGKKYSVSVLFMLENCFLREVALGFLWLPGTSTSTENIIVKFLSFSSD